MPPPTDGITLIVCGGRDYPNRANVFRVLDRVHARQPIARVIHGACKKRGSECELSGADRWAQEWAIAREVAYTGIPAHWKTLAEDGKSYFHAAGPLRNTWMLKENAGGVLAFPSTGTGTEDMCRKGHAAGLRVRVADDAGNLRKWSA